MAIASWLGATLIVEIALEALLTDGERRGSRVRSSADFTGGGHGTQTPAAIGNDTGSALLHECTPGLAGVTGPKESTTGSVGRSTRVAFTC